MRLSDEAWLALQQLDAGARFNCTHTVARELIAAGLAGNDWGVLAITEAGRRIARHDHAGILRTLDGREVVAVRSPAPEPAPASAPQTDLQKLTWSRQRASRAAGEANARCGVWVEPRWVTAFMDAYEEGS